MNLLLGLHLFVLGGEVRPVQLVDGHHDGHHVFAVHDGDGEGVLGLILGQLVHKLTVKGRLWREWRAEINYPALRGPAAPVNTPPGFIRYPHCVGLHCTVLYCCSCTGGVISFCFPLGVKQRESGSLTSKKGTKKVSESDSLWFGVKRENEEHTSYRCKVTKQWIKPLCTSNINVTAASNCKIVTQQYCTQSSEEL